VRNPENKGRRLNLLFLNAGTDLGGTEIMLLRFLEKVDTDYFDVSVAALFDRGPLLLEVRKRGFNGILFTIKHQWNPLELVYAFARLYRFLKSRRIDVVHMNGFYTNILGSLTARMAKTPVMITGVRTEASGRNGFHNILERATSNWIDLYISVSEQSRRQMLRKQWIQENKVVVVHNGIDSGWTRPIMNSASSKEHIIPHFSGGVNGCPRIGMIAAFNRLKAQEILVLAAPLVLAKFPKAKFVLMGEGKTKPRIVKLIKQTGLFERFVLPDSALDPRYILSQLTIFVLATHTEGLPVSILEAMAFGLPVVASRVGGIPEIVEDRITGLLVQPRNPESLASAIIDLLENPAKARKMGRLGKSRVKSDFGIDKMMGKLEYHYNCLAQRKGIL
jgi:glycosyltransferase involved in cell wall biosynthesis